MAENYTVSTRDVHGEQETTLSQNSDVIAKFYGAAGRRAFLAFVNGLPSFATIFDDNTGIFIRGSVDQLVA